MWRSTLYRQLVSSRAAGGPAPALNHCARPPRHRVFRPRPPSMLHADVRTNIHSLSHLTPLTPPGRRPAEASSVRSAPSSSTSLSPRGGDGPKTTLYIVATGSVCDSGTRPNPPGWQGGSQHGQTTCHRRSFDGCATRSRSWRRQVITSLLPTCLRVAGKVVSRPPAM